MIKAPITSAKNRVLTINCGSSSVKFAVFMVGKVLTKEFYGKIDHSGSSGSILTFNDLVKKQQGSVNFSGSGHASVTNILVDLLEKQGTLASIYAIGHRVVHGMLHTEPQIVNQSLLDDLHNIASYDPEHMPQEIKLIEHFIARFPKLRQLACFDTAFHQHMPRVAKLLAIPRRYEAKGIRRYGFHGLSYSYLMEEIAHLDGAKSAAGRIIMAHLGNGTSMAAILNGQCIDTTMGFTPASGLPMSTRSGDIDPGLMHYLSKTEHMTETHLHHMLNHESGLLGVSGVSSDIRELLEKENQDAGAFDALALFCYQIKKQIGAYSAALGGLDMLVFSGGIGENAAIIRSRICESLVFLGIELNQARNAKNEQIISSSVSQVKVRVICTDEELMIARDVTRTLNLN